MTEMTWPERLRAPYKGNSFLSPAQYGTLADHIEEQSATIERLVTQLGRATDALLDLGWKDVAGRMDRWAANSYFGDWTDAQYEAVS